MAFEILQGDCIELARQLPDACLDAVISDPPAGIEFLGRDWDTFGYKKGRLANYSAPPAGDVRDAEVAFKDLGQLPSFDQKVNAKCETCGKYKWSSNPCQCASPKWAKDTAARDSFVAFMTDVGKEAMRTLKPGGFLIFWAIPRTSHWTAWALEEAGFQVKHVISHLRSTGFPKGLDIGKAMDRMRDDDIYHVTAFIAKARDAAGKTNPEIDEHFNYHGMAGHWTSSKSQPAVPTWENWLKLKEFLGFDDSLDAEVQKLNGRKGKPGDAWYERPILGYETDGVQGHVFSAAGAAPTYKSEFAVTGHVSEEAHAWDGWNTALRPNFEGWLVGQKPILSAEADRLIKETSEVIGRVLWLLSPVKFTEECSRLLTPGLSVESGFALWPAAALNTANSLGPSRVTGMFGSPEEAETYLNIAWLWNRSLDALYEQRNTYTTETETRLIIDLKTLRSLLSPIIQEYTTRSENDPRIGCPWSAGFVSSLLSAAVGCMTGILTLFAPECVGGQAGFSPMLDGGAQQEENGTRKGASSEFIVLAQKPLAARNYASNVIQYGVGGLNVKGCGVPRGDGEDFGWPSNIVIEHNPGCDAETCVEGCPALELDRQSGFTKSSDREMPRPADAGMLSPSYQRACGKRPQWVGAANHDAGTIKGHGDSGGASRYYNQFHYGPEDLPSFVYVPGASRAEKEAGCAEAGIEPRVLNRVNSGGLENDPRWSPRIVYNDHPTTKSVKLMRWLCRLVVPKGATILDMFAGSGTTGVASVLEGMNFIGFDMDERYCQIARARIAHWSGLAEEAAEGGVPVLSPRTAYPAVPKAPRPAPALTLGLFDEDEG